MITKTTKWSDTKMDKVSIITLQNEFNQLSNTLEDSLIEYWYARDLQKMYWGITVGINFKML
jgi:hypothetical protein